MSKIAFVHRMKEYKATGSLTKISCLNKPLPWDECYLKTLLLRFPNILSRAVYKAGTLIVTFE